MSSARVGRIIQIGHEAPSLRLVCGVRGKGDGYTRATDLHEEKCGFTIYRKGVEGDAVVFLIRL